MADSEIPSGRNTRENQADGSATSKADGSAPSGSAAPPERESGAPDAEHRFEVGAVWTGNARGSGTVRVKDGDPTISVAGSTDLGGSGVGANPEELLLGAVAACFLNTWAIFLEKLQIPYTDPVVRVTGTLGKDPAGGFRMTGVAVHARVPQALLASDREKVQKSLGLAEKYCIISKVARAAMPLEVAIEPV